MKLDLKKYAPVGLYIALFAAVITGAYYLVTNIFDLTAQISAGFIIIGLASYAFLDPERAKAIFMGKEARYGNNAIMMLIAFAGIIIVINFLVHKNNPRWDFTQNKEHTLSSESIDALQKLPEKISAEAYFTVRFPSEAARKLLESYQYSSNGKFEYQFIDPEANPLAAQSAKVTRDGTVVLKFQGRMEQVTNISENDLTSAIIRIENPGKRAVYFLTGHGEADINGKDENAFTLVRTSLEAKNYSVIPLNLLSSPKIPDDALSIIITGPVKPISDGEINLFKDYLSKGKSIIYLSEPAYITNTETLKDPMADYLSQLWGIKLENDIIIDPSVNPPLIAVSDAYGEHAITQKMQKIVTIFPTAHSLGSVNPPQNIQQVNLVTTSGNAWGETDFLSIENNKVSFDSGKDIQGPVTVAIAAIDTVNNSRVLIVGDVNFATDKYFTNYGNADFIINSIDWAAGQENLINLTPKQPITRTIIPPKIYMLGLLFLGTIFVIPGFVVLLGITTWLQRRKKG